MTDSQILTLSIEQVRAELNRTSAHDLRTQARLNERLRELETRERSEALKADLVAKNEAHAKRREELSKLRARFGGGL